MARSKSVFAVVIGASLLAATFASAAPPSTRVTPVAASLAAYRTYASGQAALLVRMTRMLAKNIKDGEVQAAQNDYAATHRYLERIRPMLALQPDLARAVDGNADAFPGKEADPSFAGFHRIEHALYALKSTQGLSAVADRLYGDTLRLQAQVETQPIAFAALVDEPAELIDMVSTRVASGGREPYSGTDLWDIEANVDGAQAIVAALRPQMDTRDTMSMVRVETAFAETHEQLALLRDGCGFKSYDQMTADERAGLERSTTALARELAKLKTLPAID